MKINKRAKRDAKQLFRHCLVSGVLDEARVHTVVQHLVAAGQRNRPAILSHFTRLVKLELTRYTATIESAMPLPPDLQSTIAAGLTRRYGAGLQTAFTHSPALIGGMRIQVGNDVFDGSVRAGLAALAKRF